MVVYKGYHHYRKVPIIIEVDYDEELEQYFVEVTMGFEQEITSFKPKHIPEEGLIHISDLEKSVKIANNSVKALKKLARRKE